MPAPSGLSLQDVRAMVRKDLMDTDPSAYRWTDQIIDRQIDRAVARYSAASPSSQAMQVASIPGSRVYPVPDGAWYVELVEFPLGQWPREYQSFVERPSPFIADPVTAPMATPASPGAGVYLYAVTFTVPAPAGSATGETLPSPPVAALIAGWPVTLTQIPTGPAGVTGRNIYRTVLGGGLLYLLASIPDNTTTIFVDTGRATGSSGPPGTNTTQGIRQIELRLSAAQIPNDVTSWLELTCAYKQELDSRGTTIPEAHWDAIVLGAEAYAVEAYLPTVNDNFDYVDGQFRDRVDDTKVPVSWRAFGNDLMQRFQARLLEIRNEANAAEMPQVQWGDKPVRWDRL